MTATFRASLAADDDVGAVAGGGLGEAEADAARAPGDEERLT